MSAQRITRALARMASTNALLHVDRTGSGYGVFAQDDRRRRARVRLTTADVRALEAEGAIETRGDGAFGLSAAGFARVAREAAEHGEAFMAQHQALVVRHVVNTDGELRKVRGLDPEGAMRRLVALRGAKGEPWLNQAELAAAGKLRADFAVGEIGVVRVSNWLVAPMGSTRRASNAQETAMARRCDARRRVADALACLAAPLRQVVERVCLYEEGLEALERAEGWPMRSGKLALKLGLAQLAAEI